MNFKFRANAKQRKDLILLPLLSKVGSKKHGHCNVEVVGKVDEGLTLSIVRLELKLFPWRM